VRPDYAEALSNRGNTLHELKRFEEALASYDRALTVWPDYAEALCNRGVTLHELRRFEETLASYDRALTARPDYAEALCNRGNILNELKRFEGSNEITGKTMPSKVLAIRSSSVATYRSSQRAPGASFWKSKRHCTS
jgi:tetratricopeptide (TPR) repeat protein